MTTDNVSIYKHNGISAAYTHIDDAALPSAIASCTQTQRLLLSFLPYAGTKAELAARVGVKVDTITHDWLRQTTFHNAYYTLKANADNGAVDRAISRMKAALPAAVERDTELAVDANSDNPRLLSQQLRVRETIYKATGVTGSDAAPSTFNIGDVLVQIAANIDNPAGLGGITPSEALPEPD